MKRKIVLFLMMALLVGCEKKDVDTKPSISDSQPSSDNIDVVNNIKLFLNNSEVFAGDKIEYTVDFEPTTAKNKEYLLSTSTPEIISINGLEATAIFMGKGKLKASTLDGLYSSEVEIEVLKPNPYVDVIEALDIASQKELNEASESHIEYSYTSNLYSTNEEFNNYIYNDGILSVNTQNQKSEYKYITDNQLEQFIIDETNQKLTESTTIIGTSTNAISIEEATNRTKLSSYNDIYGFNNLTKSLLMDINSFYMDNMVVKASVTKENEYTYKIAGECLYFASSFDEKESKIQIEAIIDFDSNQRLQEANINIKKYLLDDNNRLSTLPSSSESYSYSLKYENRTNLPLNKSDYYVSSFDIDTTNLINENGTNVIEMEESKLINIINEQPSLHFKETYLLQIEDTTILKQGSSNLEIIGVKPGTTKVDVVSSKGVIESFYITVTKPSVKKISLGYIPNFVMIDDTFELTASCYPSSASDLTYTITVDSDVASITKSESGAYIFKALSAGQVNIIATSNSNPEVIDRKSVIIKAKPNIEQIKQQLCSKTYKATDCELSFFEDGTGSLTLQGGGAYSFSWNLRIDGTYIFIDFSNVVTTTIPDRWYDFKGTKGSYTNETATFISLIIYDMDFDENCTMQFA